MPDEKFTSTRMERTDLEILKKLAKTDCRSIPMEIKWLLQYELERRAALGVLAIQDRPAPEGGETVPLVIVEEQ